MRHSFPVLAGLLLAACVTPQPAAPVRDLAPAADTIKLTDTEISDAIWLDGDRWAVLAPAAKVIRILDFGTKTSKVLGRPGTDYLEPYAIYRAGDTLYLNDWGKRRVTIWALTGTLVGTLDSPNALRGALPHGRDSTGAWYAELRPLPGSDGSGNLDSGAVVRWTGGATTDTVVTLVPFAMERVSRDGASRYERAVLGGVDQWGVDWNGTLWIARVRQNLLQRCTAGRDRCTDGPALPDRVLEVTLQDREYFLQGFPEEQRVLARSLPFAIVKPPFDRAFAELDGTVFLEKSRMLTDTNRTYPMLDHAGFATLELRLPNAQRILGAGGGHLLAIDPFVPGPGHRVLRYVIPAVDSVVVK